MTEVSPEVPNTPDTHRPFGVTTGHYYPLSAASPQSRILSSLTTRVSKRITRTTIPVRSWWETTIRIQSPRVSWIRRRLPRNPWNLQSACQQLGHSYAAGRGLPVVVSADERFVATRTGRTQRPMPDFLQLVALQALGGPGRARSPSTGGDDDDLRCRDDQTSSVSEASRRSPT